MSGPWSGRTALVTGGTDGIGKAVAVALAAEGLRLMIVGRDRAKGTRAKDEITRQTGSAEVEYLQADLSLINEAHRLADVVNSRNRGLVYLVSGAGVVRARRQITAEGLEAMFALNYLGRFALIHRLLPLMERSGTADKRARIVMLSGAAQQGKICFDDVSLSRNFSTIRAVTQFCRANDVFATELARRLVVKAKPARVTINCLKIGVVRTNIRCEFPLWMKILVPLVLDPLIGQTPQEVATCTLRLLLDEKFEGQNGGLFLKIKRFQEVKANQDVLDPRQGQRLFELSERLVDHALRGIQPPLAATST